jgi:hypothetical protein
MAAIRPELVMEAAEVVVAAAATTAVVTTRKIPLFSSLNPTAGGLCFQNRFFYLLFSPRPFCYLLFSPDPASCTNP